MGMMRNTAGALALTASLTSVGGCLTEFPDRVYAPDGGADASGIDLGSTGGTQPAEDMGASEDCGLVEVDGICNSTKADARAIADMGDSMVQEEDAENSQDLGNPKDASIEVDAEGADSSLPTEICGDGLDNNQNGVADCDDPDCAQAPAVEVTVGRNGSVLTVFGQPPISLIEPTTLELSCEHYNQGFALDFTLDRTPQNSQNLTEVRNHVNRRLGFWIFQANEAVQFHNGGQQPLRQPDLTIINGSYGPNGQSYEGHFPYQP